MVAFFLGLAQDDDAPLLNPKYEALRSTAADLSESHKTLESVAVIQRSESGLVQIFLR